MTRPVLVWFRRDFRLEDNPALAAAVAEGQPVIPLFIDETDDPWTLGGAARWWLKRTIEQLSAPLWLRRGDARSILLDLVNEHDVAAVFWNRRYEPFGMAVDAALKATLKERGVTVQSYNGRLGREPFEVQTQSGAPYKVYTPYSRAWLALEPIAGPQAAPVGLNFMADPEPSDLGEYLPEPAWPHAFADHFTPGEAGAHAALDRFIGGPAKAYQKERDFPAKAGTSTLSPHLAFGEITPRQIMAAAIREHGGIEPVQPFIRQVIWRDFAYHNMFYFNELADQPLRKEFNHFPWVDDAAALKRWQRGRTGFPIVDSGMRELWATGYMHNRVRMIVGSFLTKDLRIDWRQGAAWFWDTLLDADLANNSMGWQWVAGSGIDAAPYFRVFNPTTQAAKFDPVGRYIRKWVPELRGVPTDQLFEPHKAGLFGNANGYPRPMVDHKQARLAALDAYQSLKAA